MTYRRYLAAGLLLLAVATCDGADYDQTCPAPTEDSRVTCELDPAARYEYDRGAWRQVDNDYRHPNGQQPPTGAEVMAIDPATD
jgi:hypothetical protein